MDKRRVQYIIQSTAQADLVNFLIDRANLTAKERSIIDIRLRLDNTQEQTAEQMERSVRWVQKHEDDAYRKIIENWNGISFLERF